MKNAWTYFSRIEKKYILTHAQQKALLALLADEIMPDTNGSADGKYPLQSYYLDTDDLFFYQEKYEKTASHKKIRIRRYGDYSQKIQKNEKIYIEIKEKKNGTTLKRRVPMTYGEALDFIARKNIPAHKEKHHETMMEIADLIHTFSLKNQVITQYDRQAFFSHDTKNEMRLTFDTNVKFFRMSEGITLKAGKIISDNETILELKVTGNFPQKILDFFKQHSIEEARISKYARSIDFSREHSAKTKNISKKFIASLQLA